MISNTSLIFSNNVITLEQIRKILYRLKTIDVLNEHRMLIKPLPSKRRISEKLAYGNFQVGCTITTDSGSIYYLFCAADTCLDKPNHVTIGGERNGSIFLISEKISNITTLANTVECTSRDFFLLHGDDIYDNGIRKTKYDTMPLDTRDSVSQIALQAISIFSTYFHSKTSIQQDEIKGNQKNLKGYVSGNGNNTIRNERGARVCLKA